MKWLLSFLLGFALVAGMAHAPAVAHAEEGHVHQLNDVSPTELASQDHDGESKSAPGPAESGAHTHLPSTLATIPDSMFAQPVLAREEFLFAKTDILTSFSQAPPTEPPSA